MKLTLTRLSGSTERTLGELEVNGIKFATIERPWLVNPDGPGGMPRRSCVPYGTYSVRPHHSERFPNTYAIVSHENGVYYQPEDIPKGSHGRSAILLHVANRVTDVIGCIGVGKEHGAIGGEPAVLRSVLAMRELDALLKRQHHLLEIR